MSKMSSNPSNGENISWIRPLEGEGFKLGKTMQNTFPKDGNKSQTLGNIEHTTWNVIPMIGNMKRTGAPTYIYCIDSHGIR